MDANYLIRQLKLDDAEAAATVHIRCWRETYTGLVPQKILNELSVAAKVEQLQRIITQAEKLGPEFDSILRVATTLDNNIIGIAIGGPPRGEIKLRDWELKVLYVLKAHHGTGIGQELLDQIAPERKPAQLWVANGNARATAFYQKNGFTLTDSILTDESGTETLMTR